MHSTWFSGTFVSFWNFPQIQDGGLISWEEPIVQNGWITFSQLLYFNIKLLKDPNSLSYIRFQCILHDSVVLLSVFENFLKLKRWDQISLGEPILENAWIIRSPLLYFNIKHLKDPNSSSFVKFQCIPNESAVLFSLIENFLKIQRDGGEGT